MLERAGLTAHVRSQGGDFEGARAVLLEAAEAVVGGPPAPLSGAAFHSQLGLLLWDIGDIDGLERGLSRALRLTEGVHGPDHPATHLARAEFGHVPFARGDYPEALAIYTAAEAALATTLPEDDLDRLGVAGWIAETLDSMSRHAEAIAALESLRSRYAAIYGDAHPLTLERLESLGRSRLRAGDHAGALADFEGALAGLRADPDWDDAAHEAVLLANIGGALMAGEDWAGAEARMLEALERLQAFHTASLDPEAGGEAGEGEDLTMQLVALEANLASIRSAKGDLAGAVEVLDACVARVDAQGVDASHNGIMIRLHLARVLVDSGDPEAAIGRAREALERAERAGSEVLRVRASLRLAGALDGAGRTRDATRALARGRNLAETLPDASEWLEAIAAYEAQRGH
ncbi:hypothetical protein PPSIR1_08292 [Plesiocystis pacifica SIR-1]|uniref:Tetratricopeptide repeat protein n=1 Tax=Plesiocystis pacifica SIR-1 TaxID=391625 RepID=A6GE33_9BACT|nr:tetratricopeptide repeat protein [Plesiocystis pacifica]EDM75899.1 hypothetical protein PPSIR1_08292 [Plesiocystis pacifica SIR-1]